MSSTLSDINKELRAEIERLRAKNRRLGDGMLDRVTKIENLKAQVWQYRHDLSALQVKFGQAEAALEKEKGRVERIVAYWSNKLNEEIENTVRAEAALEAASARMVDAIIHDLTGRRGLRQSWDGIDDEIQNEIKGKWIELARAAAKGGE